MKQGYLRRKWMGFTDIFKDSNSINEKAIIGFISFTIMVIYAVISVVGNLLGYEIPINETIYGSFVTVTLGSFGIATVGQAINDYSRNRMSVPTEEYTPIKQDRIIEENQTEVNEYKNATNRD